MNERGEKSADDSFGQKTVQVSFRVSPPLHGELTGMAEELGIELAGLLRQMVYYARPEFHRRRLDNRIHPQLRLAATALEFIELEFQNPNRQVGITERFPLYRAAIIALINLRNGYFEIDPADLREKIALALSEDDKEQVAVVERLAIEIRDQALINSEEAHS